MSTNKSNNDKYAMIPGITGDINYENPLFIMPAIIAPYKVGILSYSASLLSTTVGFPLDSIKTRMQTHSYKNALDCFQSTIKNEGLKGLFRGILAPLISTSFSRSFTVSIYTNSKPLIASILPQFHLNNISNNQTKRFIQNFPVSFLSGMVSGAVISLFACPFELTKIFQQIVIVVNRDTNINLNSKNLPTKVLDVANNIIKFEGLKGLYSGYRYHIIRDSISAGLFYSVYETVKLQLQLINKENNYFSDINKSRIDALCVPFSGAIAGGLAWFSVYPLDTIKSQYQRDILSNIIRVKMGLDKEKIVPRKLCLPTKEMYRGFGPSITRSICVTMIFFSTFEFLMKNIA